MRKDFIPNDQALQMNEIGFNEPCLVSWNFYTNEMNYNGKPSTFQSDDVIQLPSYSQAFRWFRENYGLDYEITNAGRKGEYNAFVQDYVYGNNRNSPSVFSYEEAELACLVKLIEIVKNK